MKKKFLIFTAATVAALLCLIGIAGCKPKAKTFEKAGMQITLTSSFNEKEYIGQTVCYQSAKVIVFAVKEEFTSFDSDLTLKAYTTRVLYANNMQFKASFEREGQEYLYFTYEKAVSGQNYYYMATTHKGPDAFWLIQFACFTSDKDKYTESFFKWADSVTFLTADGANET
ncbi:MAG: hypothetical protein K2K60_06695, partial [Clostridia bacterium]|nr:hypothetical protein [Clostridia bacterium]